MVVACEDGSIRLLKVKLGVGKLQLSKFWLSNLRLKLKLHKVKLAKLLVAKFFDKLSRQASESAKASWRS